IVSNVGIPIPLLRQSQIALKLTSRFIGIALSCNLSLSNNVVRIDTSKPSLSASVIPCAEVIQPGLKIPFLCGELLPNTVNTETHRTGPVAVSGRNVLSKRQEIMPFFDLSATRSNKADTAEWVGRDIRCSALT